MAERKWWHVFTHWTWKKIIIWLIIITLIRFLIIWILASMSVYHPVYYPD